MIGKVINKYRIDAKLGEGGMGVVYKAWDTVLERPVALKRISNSISTHESFIKRFVNEAKALAKLQHANIVSVYDLLQHEDEWFIVMEFVEGKSLDKKLKQGEITSYLETLPIFKQILTAVGHAHQAGIIHRDLKPANVMLTPEGLVKVMDFGLAKIQSEVGLTGSTSTGGTLFYMSPEQVKPKSKDGGIDHRSDIYAIGMTCYEVLAGRTPFKKTDTQVEILNAILRDNYPPPTKFNAQIPKALSQIVMRAVAQKPARRYQSTAEMQAAIENFEKQLPANTVTLTPPTAGARLKKSVPYFVFLIGLAFILVSLVQFFFPNFYKQVLDTLGIASYAKLAIQTRPDSATVRLNGKLLGVSPINSRRVSPRDTNQIFIQKPGYVEIDTSVILQQDQDTTLVFDLSVDSLFSPPNPPDIDSGQKDVGSLEVTATPEGANIWLDGKLVGKTRFRSDSLLVGERRLLVRRGGYQDSLQTVRVFSNKTTRVKVALTRLMGTLKLLVIPYGSIYIDDKLKKEDADQEYTITLTAGIHKVRVEHPVYGKRESDVDIKPNQLNELTIDFENQ